MFGKLRGIFGGERREAEDRPLYGLEEGERARIGTDDDPLKGFEAAQARHEDAARAEQNGDADTAMRLYEESVAGGFVGAFPYERLAHLLESRRDHEGALRACEAFVDLARSGRMPPGAQRSADRRLPEFEARIRRLRGRS